MKSHTRENTASFSLAAFAWYLLLATLAPHIAGAAPAKKTKKATKQSTKEQAPKKAKKAKATKRKLLGTTRKGAVLPYLPDLYGTRSSVRTKLSAQSVMNHIRRRRNSLKFCYEAYLRKHRHSRLLPSSIRIVVGPKGRVTSVKVKLRNWGKQRKKTKKSKNLGEKKLKACLTRVIKSFRFAKPKGGSIIITYPLSEDAAH